MVQVINLRSQVLSIWRSGNRLGTTRKIHLIRDNKNREAWILTSELSTTPSSREENPKLKAQVQELTLKLNRVDSDWQQRTNEIQTP